MKIYRIVILIVFCWITVLGFGCSRPGGEQPNIDKPEDTEPSRAEEEAAQTESPVQDSGLIVPVEAMVLRSTNIEQNVPLTGVAHPILAVDLIAEVSGKVEQVARKLGDFITTSDTLAVIDDLIPLSNYRRAESQVLSAENNLRIAELNTRSDEELFESGDISQLDLENSRLALKMAEANVLAAQADLEMAEKTYKDTRIMSPIAGHISRKYIDLGTMVMPNSPVFRVVDLSTLKVELGVPQSMISRVRVGGPAIVRFSALGSKEYGVTVRYISPQADEMTGTFQVEVHVKNTPGTEIKAGMTTRVELILRDFGEQLVIPDHALVTKNGSNHVYRIENGIAKLTDIDLHAAFGAQVVVDSGLAEGDTIVVVGMKSLGVGTRVFIESIQ